MSKKNTSEDNDVDDILTSISNIIVSAGDMTLKRKFSVWMGGEMTSDI